MKILSLIVFLTLLAAGWVGYLYVFHRAEFDKLVARFRKKPTTAVSDPVPAVPVVDPFKPGEAPPVKPLNPFLRYRELGYTMIDIVRVRQQAGLSPALSDDEKAQAAEAGYEVYDRAPIAGAERLTGFVLSADSKVYENTLQEGETYTYHLVGDGPGRVALSARGGIEWLEMHVTTPGGTPVDSFVGMGGSGGADVRFDYVGRLECHVTLVNTGGTPRDTGVQHQSFRHA